LNQIDSLESLVGMSLSMRQDWWDYLRLENWSTKILIVHIDENSSFTQRTFPLNTSWYGFFLESRMNQNLSSTKSSSKSLLVVFLRVFTAPKSTRSSFWKKIVMWSRYRWGWHMYLLTRRYYEISASPRFLKPSHWYSCLPPYSTVWLIWIWQLHFLLQMTEFDK
jgi:hypothetical protein